jgi:aryl-alcohol dehydrogenase-like predicted oxidoreductase
MPWRPIRVHTKCVPDLDKLPTLTRADLEATIDRSLQPAAAWSGSTSCSSTGGTTTSRAPVDAALHLKDLQAEGKIAHVSGTNFDAAHVAEIAAAGVPFTTMQVQYSLLDRRPAGAFTEICAAQGTQLLCYGSLAGGFLTDAWLGKPAPTTLTNRSLIKYRLIIDEFGGWPLFQTLLQTLRRIADRHATTIAAVAARHVLDQPQVAAVIVGASHSRHLADTLRIGSTRLDAADNAEIAAVLAQAEGPTGPVYALERDRTGRHGSIMKYNLGDAKA